MTNVEKSNDFKNRALNVIPHQTGTFSRAADHFVEGVYPSYIESAEGAYFTDVDGNRFLDYLCGLGPITLGYNYEPVNSAIINQLKKGILFSLPHRIEVELSELFCQTIPHADMVKFEKSGSNAVTGAVRAARAITKKDKIAYCGSGGVWHDWQAAMVSRDDGVPKFNSELIKIFEYNDIEGLEQIFEDNRQQIAAIVLEPTIFEKPENDFLNRVRKLADENNTLLILDEVITGFRFDIKGGQKYFNIKGDMTCFGKGMGNGLPISAISGPEEFMSAFDKLWVSSTNNSETLSMAGTIAVINEMDEKKTVDYCWERGNELLEGWNNISDEYQINAKMRGYPVRMFLDAKDQKDNQSPTLRALILQELIKEGIFMSPSWCAISYSHSEDDIQNTLRTYEKICRDVISKKDESEYSDMIQGKMPSTVWTMKIGPTKKRIK